MRGYGNDYDRGGSFFDRAGEKMREWFGGGPPEYDRDYDAPRHNWGSGMRASGTGWGRDRDRGTDWTGAGQGGGWRTNNWSNTSADLDSVRGAGSYYGADYDRERTTYRAGGSPGNRGMDYDRDYGGGTSGGYMGGGGTSGGYMGGGYGSAGMGRNREWDQTRWNRGREGQPRMRHEEGRGGSPMGNEYFRGDRGSYPGGGGSYQGGGEYGRAGYNSSMGGGGYDAGNDWGDYDQGGYGGDRFRTNNSGGVEPGRHFRGYGHGSTGGNGYKPL